MEVLSIGIGYFRFYFRIPLDISKPTIILGNCGNNFTSASLKKLHKSLLKDFVSQVAPGISLSTDEKRQFPSYGTFVNRFKLWADPFLHESFICD